METHAAFIRADGRAELHAPAAVYLHLIFVIHPRDTELNNTLRLDQTFKLVEALNPRHVLDRGYALVTDRAGGVLSSAAAARKAGALTVRFGDGEVAARVEGTPGKAYAKAAPDQPTLL